MDLKEYLLPENSMIGGWYLPPLICDDLVTLFKESKEYQAPGVVGPPLRIDPDEKKSTEVPIHPSYDHPTFIVYKNLIGNIINLYEKRYPEIEEFSKFGMTESCQIQHYKPGEGFKKWHFESCQDMLTFFHIQTRNFENLSDILLQHTTSREE